MARYSGLLGHKVEVTYRAGAIVLPASGTLVADSGRSIFLEQRFDQHGHARQFRWEIPYQYIVRINEALAGTSSPAAPSPVGSAESEAQPVSENAAAAAVGASASSSSPKSR